MNIARFVSVIILAVFLVLIPVYEKTLLTRQTEKDRVSTYAKELVLEVALEGRLTLADRQRARNYLTSLSPDYSLAFEVGHKIVLVNADGEIGDTLYEYQGDAELEKRIISEGDVRLKQGDIVRAVITKASDGGFCEESFSWIL